MPLQVHRWTRSNRGPRRSGPRHPLIRKPRMSGAPAQFLYNGRVNRVRRRFKTTSQVQAYKDQEEGYAQDPRMLSAGTCLWAFDEDDETRVLNGRRLKVVLCWIEGGQTRLLDSARGIFQLGGKTSSSRRSISPWHYSIYNSKFSKQFSEENNAFRKVDYKHYRQPVWHCIWFDVVRP